MAEPRKICCCQAVTWARVIAWLQIVFNALVALFIILLLAGVTGAALSDKNEEGKDNTKYGQALAIFIIGLVASAVGIIFGVILLKGTNDKRPTLLKIWMIVTAIVLIWAIVEAALSGAGLASKIINCTVKILIYGFGIWVVHSVKREIELENENQKY